jgi:hypothetical protein
LKYNETDENTFIKSDDTSKNDRLNTKNTSNSDDDITTYNYKKNKKHKKNKIYKKTKKNTSDNLSVLLHQLKKEHNSHIFNENDTIYSRQDDSIIKHLRKCHKCKSKIKLVFDNTHHKNLNNINTNNNSDTSNQIIIKFSVLKEYLILILLFFLILLIIYIFYKLN